MKHSFMKGVYRHIDGEVFHRTKTGIRKPEAESRAESHRKRGASARVVKASKGYSVYVRG